MTPTARLLAGALMLGATFAQANEFEPAMRGYLEAEVAQWLDDPVILDRLRQQNEFHAALSQGDIDEMDSRWRNEVGATATPMIDAVLQNAASEFLRQQVADSVGVISEVFVMDMRGLNAAASGVTSDYWQGDEAKFQKTYDMGPEAVHFGEVEFDESSQTYQAQVSVTIRDPGTGEPIGAMTIGLNAEALM